VSVISSEQRLVVKEKSLLGSLYGFEHNFASDQISNVQDNTLALNIPIPQPLPQGRGEEGNEIWGKLVKTQVSPPNPLPSFEKVEGLNHNTRESLLSHRTPVSVIQRENPLVRPSESLGGRVI